MCVSVTEYLPDLACDSLLAADVTLNGLSEALVVADALVDAVATALITAIENSPFRLTRVFIAESFDVNSPNGLQLSAKVDVAVSFVIANQPVTVELNVDSQDVHDVMAQLGDWVVGQVRSFFM